ncbi:mechanosensitive ion channel family protein [Mesoaciditoga lauensis]|uniref:mechanosensitive ion channel family protein n=1 Tax=Mesoaciditoga lauensis TaxID=1495039 RepID=UPI00068F306E|nr:mechanosensitive ion channel family protein [Mesoaciditoga lauensis]
MTDPATSLISGFNAFLTSYGIKIIISIVVFIVTYYIARYTFKLWEATSKKVKKPLKYPNTTYTLVKVTFFSIAGLIVLGIFNIDLWPILASLGVVGLIVGLALQQPLGNFFSGVLIFITDAVNEGEALDIGGVSGVVRETKFNHTVVDTWDGKRIYIPNTAVWSSKVTKFWPKVARRVDMAIGIPYTVTSQQLAKVSSILEKAMEDEPLVYKGENYSVGPKKKYYGPVSNSVTFNDFGASSINFTMHFWVLRDDYFKAIEKVAIDAYEALNAAGISMPYNQLDVHVDGKLETINLENRENKRE